MKSKHTDFLKLLHLLLAEKGKINGSGQETVSFNRNAGILRLF